MTTYVYDLEIKKAIPSKDPAKLRADVEYCDGWKDHAAMGISVLGVARAEQGTYAVYLDDNQPKFLSDVENFGTLLVGYNNLQFDDKVIAATFPVFSAGRIPGIPRYDILREIWLSENLPETWVGTAQSGYGLDDMALANGLGGKIGNGAEAPIDWQQGRLGKVITYCLDDVHKTLALYRIIQETGKLYRPVMKGGGIIKMPAEPTPF